MKYLIRNKHWNIVEDYNIDKILYLLIDRPNLLYDNYDGDDFIWENDNSQRHRNYDLPAYIDNTMYCYFWYVRNKIKKKFYHFDEISNNVQKLGIK